MSDPVSIICIGGAAVDRKYYADKPVLPGTSNPVRGEQGFGGVARNVAENLAGLGVPCRLISVVGDDGAGRSITEHLQRAGVEVGDILSLPATTAEYVAVLDPDGSLVVAVADMAILDNLTPARLAPMRPRLEEADWLFADCNLPRETLQAVIAMVGEFKVGLAVDTVSVAKSGRLPENLAGIDLLFLNRDEAAAILGAEITSADAAVRHLLARGAARIVLTLGAEGCMTGGPDGMHWIAAIAADAIDVTGAGDALVSGTLAGLVAGRSLQDAVAAGTRAAAAAVAVKASTIPAR